jgi:FkbM family methyltransferase
MINILKYIYQQNPKASFVKYLFIGAVFQVFKRLTGKVVSKKLFNGQSIFLYPRCNVSTMFAYTCIPDREEIMVLRKLLNEKKDSTFLDIGANIGSYSVCLMDICENIIAFEPHPYTAKRCKMNFLLNGKNELNVKQIAISDSNGTVFFSDHGGSSTVNSITTHQSGIEVQAMTLDQFVRDQRLSTTAHYVLKVDVEGFEKQVFLGAKEFLTQYPIAGIVFECFDTDAVFPILKSCGYRMSSISTNNFLAQKGEVR